MYTKEELEIVDHIENDNPKSVPDVKSKMQQINIPNEKLLM